MMRFGLKMWLLTLLVWSASLASAQRVTLNGYWAVRLEGEGFTDLYLFQFRSVAGDSLTGKVFYFRNRRFRFQTSLRDVTIKRNIVTFAMRTTVEMKYWGIWVAGDESINGELRYVDGTEVPWTMIRLSEKEAEEYLRLIPERE